MDHFLIVRSLRSVELRYLRPVSLLGSEGRVHHVFDGEARHGALSEGDDLIDAFHHGVQLGVGLQGELTADLRTEEDGRWTTILLCFFILSALY